MNKHCVSVAEILMPNAQTDINKWAVVACDQYTSQPEYWQETSKIVGESVSTLNLILPEVYLEHPESSKYIHAIHKTMNEYLEKDVFTALPKGMILVSRDTNKKCTRKGLIMAFDLEEYEYTEGSMSKIRPTEKTVVERIPPRLSVRNGASVELPHIMIMIDDPERKIIEPLYENREQFSKLYDVNLIQNGGNIQGWFIPESKQTDDIINLIHDLQKPEVFAKKYNVDENTPVLPFAVGDGNHSMATAKAYWENIKKSLPQSEIADHPARFVLAELVNIHDESIEIEPIHRIVFDVDIDDILKNAVEFFKNKNAICNIIIGDEIEKDLTNKQIFKFNSKNKAGYLILENSPYALHIASLQAFLDDYLQKNTQSKIDYIHGDDVLNKLSNKDNCIGFFLPTLAKEDIFKGVILDGVLPRKTFSMGDAREKRFYMEAKKIVR